MRTLIAALKYVVEAGDVIDMTRHPKFKSKKDVIAPDDPNSPLNDVVEVEVIHDLSIDSNHLGDHYDLAPNKAEKILNDYNLLWPKDFFEKWSKEITGKPFEKVFDEDEFSGQAGRAVFEGEYNISINYRLTFEDGSVVYIVFPYVDSTEPEYEVMYGGTKGDNQASNFEYASGEGSIRWTTDDLDKRA